MTSDFDELERELNLGQEDCGCGKKGRMQNSMASPEEMEAALDNPFADHDLDLGDDLDDFADSGDQISLSDLIMLVEQHPGIKITISSALAAEELIASPQEMESALAHGESLDDLASAEVLFGYGELTPMSELDLL